MVILLLHDAQVRLYKTVLVRIRAIRFRVRSRVKLRLGLELGLGLGLRLGLRLKLT